jgi:hypothetical protein
VKLLKRLRRRSNDLPLLTYMRHALIGEAFSARMFSENPGISDDTRRAYEWAEEQFLRIANRQVGERDLIG